MKYVIQHPSNCSMTLLTRRIYRTVGLLSYKICSNRLILFYIIDAFNCIVALILGSVLRQFRMLKKNDGTVWRPSISECQRSFVIHVQVCSPSIGTLFKFSSNLKLISFIEH